VLGYQQESAAGTGIVLTSTGEILTNNHVVEGATSIRVTDVHNGRTYTGEVVGTDATQDIAVIQLENASGLVTANLGNSSTLKTGEPVLAIGNAGGVGGPPSTAAGAVVALGQSITATDDSGANPENLTGLVETDAPIQPGDSGGPLATASGQVVAIDTAASSGDQYQSSSTQAYAIPINTALGIAGQIENGDSSTTVHIGEAAMLGVEVEPAADASGAASTTGAFIAEVVPGSPAASAGLSRGDVIVSLNGQAVDSPSDLSKLMSSRHPGERVTVGIDDSSGQLETVTLTLAAGPPA
jgi:S1-C subfamily serine protease